MQIVHSSRRGSRDVEHIGSAHDDAQLEILKAAARQRLAAGQGELDLGLGTGVGGGGPLPITSSRMGHLWDALARAYGVLGFDAATDGDEVFRALVLARVIEPTSGHGPAGPRQLVSPQVARPRASDTRPARFAVGPGSAGGPRA